MQIYEKQKSLNRLGRFLTRLGFRLGRLGRVLVASWGVLGATLRGTTARALPLPREAAASGGFFGGVGGLFGVLCSWRAS